MCGAPFFVLIGYLIRHNREVGKRVVGTRVSRSLCYPPNDVFRLRNGFNLRLRPGSIELTLVTITGG
jgi:hypothetical protein